MNGSKKPNSREELQRIEDAWIESILEAPADEIRAEIKEAGDSAEAYIALADAMLRQAVEHCGRETLDRARTELRAFRANQPQVVSLEQARAELHAMKHEPSPSQMLAARKGRGLSKRDEEALLRAEAELKRLESEDEKS